jgi:hypothetical protein
MNGIKLWRRPRPKLGCGAKERERVSRSDFIALNDGVIGE